MGLKKTVEKLGGDFESLRREYLAIAGTLSKLGLSEYESRAYIALVALGPGSASFVAEMAQIPRTSAYKVMASLERNGLARKLEGRPQAFAPADPSEASKRFVSEIEDAFCKIAAVRDTLSPRGVPQLVYTVMGKDMVLDKVGEMLDKCEHAFVMSSPSLTQMRPRLWKKFSAAMSRGVRLTVITSPFVKVPKGARVIRRKGLIATDVIADGKTALLAAPDLSACGYTDNEALSRHLEDFLNIMVERSD